MNKREVIRLVMEHKQPPYVPWACGFTLEAFEKLKEYYGAENLDAVLASHMVGCGGNTFNLCEPVDENSYIDPFGVLWDRTVDKDIGVVKECLLPDPTLKDYQFPDPLDPRFFKDMHTIQEKHNDLFLIFGLDSPLYERAWMLRGMSNLLMDMLLHPDFVHELLHTLADFHIATIKQALTYNIDAVYIGDDYGQQHGLQMGPQLWHEFIGPELKRICAVVRDAGKFVLLHSCGDVDELFDDFVEYGITCVNPFQPEVMDVFGLLNRYRGSLCFHGGLSTQETLPYGTVDDVKQETRRLIESGKKGGYIFAPAHAVEGDVPVENMVAFIEEIRNQDGFLATIAS